jgi:hypothetical protein
MRAHPVEVDEFAAQARTFMQWCEASHGGKSGEQMQREALQRLSETYAAALRLPGVDFVPSPDPPSQTEAGRIKLSENLRPLPFQYYWEMFTPTDMDQDKEPVCGDLFDDFLDIYGDLSSGLWLYDRKHLEAAVFTWSQMFGVHWGRHAVSAMHALHSFEPKEEQNAF